MNEKKGNQSNRTSSSPYTDATKTASSSSPIAPIAPRNASTPAPPVPPTPGSISSRTVPPSHFSPMQISTPQTHPSQHQHHHLYHPHTHPYAYAAHPYTHTNPPRFPHPQPYPHPSTYPSPSFQQPLSSQDIMNESGTHHMYTPPPHIPPTMGRTIQASSSPSSSEIDPATGLPLSVLNNLHELLPPVSERSAKNKSHATPSKKKTYQTVQNAGLDPFMTKSNTHTHTHTTTSTPRYNIAPTSTTTASDSYAPSSFNNPYIHYTAGKPILSPLETEKNTNVSYYPPGPPLPPNKSGTEQQQQQQQSLSTPNTTPMQETSNQTPSSSNTSLIEHLKGINRSLHQTITSGNMSIYSLESQLKLMDQECQSYHYSIDELNLKLEMEKRLRKQLFLSLHQKEGRGEESGYLTKLKETEKSAADESNVNVGSLTSSSNYQLPTSSSSLTVMNREDQDKIPSNYDQMKNIENQNNILLKQIDSLEKKLDNEKDVSKRIHRNMERDLLQECEELDQAHNKEKDLLNKEYENLLDTNKALLEQAKQNSPESKTS